MIWNIDMKGDFHNILQLFCCLQNSKRGCFHRTFAKLILMLERSNELAFIGFRENAEALVEIILNKVY